MRKFTLPLMIAALMLATAFITIGVARGQGSDPQIIQRETQGDSVREIAAPPDGNAPQQPNIGFIDSPSATCYQPDPGQDWVRYAVCCGCNGFRERSLRSSKDSQ